MKLKILAVVFSIATFPVFAQTQSSSTTEHTQEHSATTTNPDGTAVHNSTKSHEQTNSNTNPDGSSSTTQTKEKHSKTKVKNNSGSDSTTTEHHSSSTSDTKTNTAPPPEF